MSDWIKLETSDCNISYISRLPKEDSGMAVNFCYSMKKYEQLGLTASEKWALSRIKLGKRSKSTAILKEDIM